VRLWDQEHSRTVVMRDKEMAHDYRYFPEPDLRPLELDDAWIAHLRETLPELPRARAARFVATYGLPTYDAGVLTLSTGLSRFFEAVAQASGNPKAASNWIMGELLGRLNRDGLELEQALLTPAHLAGLIQLIDRNVISGKMAKAVFEEAYATGEAPDAIVEARGLKQVTDTGALEALIDAALAASPKEVEAWRAGKEKVFGFFVGQVMKASKGQANPALLNALLKQKLSG